MTLRNMKIDNSVNQIPEDKSLTQRNTEVPDSINLFLPKTRAQVLFHKNYRLKDLELKLNIDFQYK